jgi:hypothetical protein
MAWVLYWLDSVSHHGRSAVFGVPPARPPYHQLPAGMGSLSGRSGRAWTPLWVECRELALPRGAAPAARLYLYHPPVAPCRCPGTQKCVRAVPLRASPDYELRDAAWGRAGGREAAALLGFRWWSLTAAHSAPALPSSGCPSLLVRMAPVALMLWEGG